MSQKTFTRTMSLLFITLAFVFLIGHYGQSEGTILSTGVPSWVTALIVAVSGFIMYAAKNVARKEATQKSSKDA